MKRSRPLAFLAACVGVVLGVAVAVPARAAEAPVRSAGVSHVRAAAGAHDPVIFVHGYGGSAADVAAVTPGLEAAGYSAGEIFSLDFPNGELNEDTAARLSSFVDQTLASTGASKADLIGFSMGSLSARYYLKDLGGTAKIAHFASISGPNHGTDYAYFCFLISSDSACPEMQPGSALLTGLNSGSETPGPTVYATWVSHCDDLISPPDSTFLAGATNTWTADCLTHNETPSDPQVTSGIAAFFQGS